MRLPPYGLCERGDPGSSPAGPREASPLVVISQPAPIAPHLSGPAEDSSSDSVSSGDRVGPSPVAQPPEQEVLAIQGSHFFLRERRQAQPVFRVTPVDSTPKPHLTQ